MPPISHCTLLGVVLLLDTSIDTVPLLGWLVVIVQTPPELLPQVLLVPAAKAADGMRAVTVAAVALTIKAALVRLFMCLLR